MYFKAQHFKDDELATQIAIQSNPALVKELGRQVKGFNEDDWIAVREKYMYMANYEKYKIPKLKKRLIGTDNKILVEGSPYDKIWGVGLKFDDQLILDEKNWNGLNLLGKCLMQVREDIK